MKAPPNPQFIANPFKIINSEYVSSFENGDCFIYKMGRLVYFSIRFWVARATTTAISVMDFKDEYAYLRPVNYNANNGFVTEAHQTWSNSSTGLLFINTSFKIGLGAGFQANTNYIVQGIYFI